MSLFALSIVVGDRISLRQSLIKLQREYPTCFDVSNVRTTLMIIFFVHFWPMIMWFAVDHALRRQRGWDDR